MSWASFFPDELIERPLGLIALSGLDIIDNVQHRAIYDSFVANRKAERLPLRFKIFPGDYDYPKSKPKRTSYEWYIPKGILKTGWLHKHLSEVPSVVVIFFDLDWDDPQFRERQIECASRVRVVRECLSGRTTRVVVVLLQKKTPLLLDEDLSAKERAPSLCSACELNPNHLFVLAQTEHLYGYIIRLENAFFDLSQSYYHQESRKVKSHRDNLNKISHQLLFVRHQFKIAFFYELKQDPVAALKHYKECYGYILDLRLHEKHVLETKMIAGFVNYKICKLLFQKNAMDAIKQFKSFTDFFKDRVGMMELAFEHYAWLSKQNAMFGELFNDAVKMGLSAVQMQHPGIYFQEAAKHAIRRKTHSQKLCRFVDLSEKSDPLSDFKNLEFYGQRPWRQGNQSFDPPDYNKERDGIQALQNAELSTNISSHIISLLSQAVHYFKKYKSQRTKQYLFVQMSEEHYNAQQYSQSLSCLSSVLDEYRSEGWWNILTSILLLPLRSSYMIASAPSYVHSCLELIGSRSCLSSQERLRIQKNLFLLSMSGIPEPEETTGDIVQAQKAWQEAPTKDIFVEMDKLNSFLSCKVVFTQATFSANEAMTLKIYFLSKAVETVVFNKMSVIFSNQVYNDKCAVSDSKLLTFEPEKVCEVSFELVPDVDDSNKVVTVTSVALSLGGNLESTSGINITLRWKISASQAAQNPFHTNAFDAKKQLLSWSDIIDRPLCRVTRKVPSAKLSLHHDPPALVNEHYFVRLSLSNHEENEIHSLKLTCSCSHPTIKEGEAEPPAHMNLGAPVTEDNALSSLRKVPLSSIPKGETVDFKLYLQFFLPGDCEVAVEIEYETRVCVLGQSVNSPAFVKQTFFIPTIHPFEISPEVLSMSFAPIPTMSSVALNDPFILLVNIRSGSPWSINIEQSDLKLGHHVSGCGGSAESGKNKFESQISGCTFSHSERLTECFVLAVDAIKTSKLGTYSVRWRRLNKSGDDCLPFVTTCISVPTVAAYQLRLAAELNLPALGIVYQPLLLSYSLENRTAYPQEIEFTLDKAEGFVFSGKKTVNLRILPSSNHCLKFWVYPLLTGYVELPRVQIKLDKSEVELYSVLKDFPTHLFIKPLGKSTDPSSGANYLKMTMQTELFSV